VKTFKTRLYAVAMGDVTPAMGRIEVARDFSAARGLIHLYKKHSENSRCVDCGYNNSLKTSYQSLGLPDPCTFWLKSKT